MTPNDDLTAMLSFLKEHDRKAFERVKILLSASEMRHGLPRQIQPRPSPWERFDRALPHINEYSLFCLVIGMMGLVLQVLAPAMAHQAQVQRDVVLLTFSVLLTVVYFAELFILTPLFTWVTVKRVWAALKA